MKYTDYYKTLGVEKTATDKEIRSAFRKLAKEYHPDTHPGDTQAEQRFKEINEAYEVLGDKDKRAKYDQLGANWNQYQDLGDMFGGFGRSRGHKVEFGSQIFDLNFSDFFETFFGDQSNQFWDKHTSSYNDPLNAFRRNAPPPPQEVNYHAEITLEEAIEGTRRRIQLQDGKTLEVKIPPGVREGSKVRVGSQGQNVFLLIRFKTHPVFQVDGNHLRRTVRVMDYEAMLGTRKSVQTPTGSIQMKIPPGSQAGQVFRIKGHGLPQLKNPHERGDLLVALDIAVSKDLSPEESDLIEKFRSLREARV